MTLWRTPSDLSARYAVTTERLLAHAHRGHLPVRRGSPDGLLLDETTVAQLFPRREASIGAAPPHLGLLGTVRLAAPAPPVPLDQPAPLPSPAPAPDPRADRRHATRLSGLRSVSLGPTAPLTLASTTTGTDG